MSQDSTTSGSTSIDPIDSSGTGSGEGLGTCVATCEIPSDCTPLDDETDWACTDGFCRFVGMPLCDPFRCEIVDLGVCSDVDGISTCTTPCTAGGGECIESMQECTGTDDLGTLICRPPPCGGNAEGEPCLTIEGDSYGTCIDAQCTCQVDEECTVFGLSCKGSS